MADKPNMLGTVVKYYFFQANDFVEENKKIETYWGFFAHAEYNTEEAEKNAIVEKKTFGPEKTKHKNPYENIK